MRKHLIKGLLGFFLILTVVIAFSLWNVLPYQGWDKYENKALPSSLIINMGEDLKGGGDIYPGFDEVGNMIVSSQKKPSSLDIYPKLTESIKVEMADLIGSGAIAGFNWRFSGPYIEVKLKDKTTGQIKTLYWTDPEKVSPKITLDNSVTLGTPVAKRYLLLKEFSHILYWNEFKKIMEQEITKNNEIITLAKAPIADLLIVNAHINRGSISTLSYDVPKLIDYAGYWHVVPAFGMLVQRGGLSDEDIRVMTSSKKAFDRAIERGLLVKKNNRYVWKVGPFSKEWIEIMSSIF